MLFCDAHCDIFSKIETPDELFMNHHHWDAQRALKNGPFIQVFSSFAGDRFRDHPKVHMEAQFIKALMIEKKYPDRLKLIRSQADLEIAVEDSSLKRIYGLLEAEGAEILGGSIEELNRLYREGLRILTLVWNYDNEVCDSVAGVHSHKGLSEFGRNVIHTAQRLGMLIDVSHASDKTFDDCIAITQKPIMASHSNSRALCGHRRNLTDDQIKAVAQTHGIIGINFYPLFLSHTGNAHFVDIIRHIEYIAGLAGPAFIGIGSDFDGFSDLPEGMTGVEDLYRIMEALLRLNYSQHDVEGIAGINFTSLLSRVL